MTNKVKFPIAFKLVLVTVALLVSATVPIAFKSSSLFQEVSGQREEASNRDQAYARSNEIEGLLTSYVDKTRVVASLLTKSYSSGKEKEEALSLSFKRDRDLVSVEVISNSGHGNTVLHKIVNSNYLAESEVKANYLETLKDKKQFPIASVFSGNLEIRNSSIPGGLALVSVGLPFHEDQFGKVTHIALAHFKLERIQKTFANVSERTVYLIDQEGVIIAHPNDKFALESKSMKDSAIVEEALKSKVRQGQRRFKDIESDEWYVGAFTKTSFGITVIAQASENVILEPARNVQRQAFYIAGLVLSAALFFTFLFSISITSPIEKLLVLTKEIAKGNFDVKSTVKTHDEVGELGLAFNSMLEGLKERDKAKNLLSKFHGAVAEDMMKGEIQLGGSKKEVTVFFSDIRDFTKFSEGHTPEEVVEMLNEYFAIMVEIITRNHGVVDKFVGDAIMAVWGSPKSTGQDSYYAVKTCMEMRSALALLNEKRATRGKTPIKIGMGLHSGPAISGNIGSSERMEFTVIGDTVNMASRIEASTKAFGSDLLISEVTAKEVENNFILESAGEAEVKGKTKPLKFFKVRGYINEKGEKVVIKTQFSDFAAADADKVKVSKTA